MPDQGDGALPGRAIAPNAITFAGKVRSRAIWLSASGLWLLTVVACSHGPLVHEPAPMPDSSVRANPPIAPDSGLIPVSPPPKNNEEVPPADEQRIAVTSEPSGARVLVNNQPVGRTPLRLAVKITPQGFCADYVTVRARFVAEDATQVSQTVDVQLTPLEKPPATLVFTTAGAQRRMK